MIKFLILLINEKKLSISISSPKIIPEILKFSEHIFVTTKKSANL